MSPPAPELDRSFQRSGHGIVAVSGLQGEDLADLAGQGGHSGCGGTGQERGRCIT